MSISNLLNATDQSYLNINANNANIFDTLTVKNLQVTGSTNLATASARYNIAPQPPPRVGILTGYLIFAADPNPSFIPFETNTTMGLYDYINPSGNFTMIDPYTLQINVTGLYTFSFQMVVLSNSAAQVIFQLLSSRFPFTVGGVPPICFSLMTAFPLIVLPTPYTDGCVLNASANASLNAGETVKLAYLTTADGEIPLTSNLCINKIG